jgi:putative ABC transport system permease protein
LTTLYNDLRYGLRMLAANPGFTAVAILSLAIGIGANTAMFSLADAMLLRPLPVPNSSEVVRVMSTSQTVNYGQVSYPDYIDFRDQSKTLSGLVACEQAVVGFNADPSSPSQIKVGLAVSPNFFDVLGVKPALGRGFRPDEDRAPVVVLTDLTWQSQFARDPGIVGRTIRLSKIDFTIIGVAPKNFPGLDRYVHESLYVPLVIRSQLSPDNKEPLSQRDALTLSVFGRLAPGHTASEAQSELQAIARNLERAYPETNLGRGALAMTEIQARTHIDPDDALQTAILLAIAGSVLLIACANVANLLLSRARARSREIAIRLAIGASRMRLLQQLLTESLLLSLAGGAGGLLLALFCIDFFSSVRFPTSLPLWLVTRPDLRVLSFCLAASVLSAIIFGLAPALHAIKSDLNNTLKAGDSALMSHRRRFQVRNVLAVAQIAISMMLLLASGLLVKDFSNLIHARAGFRTDHVLVASLDPALVRYQEPQGRAFYRDLVEHLRQLPGVRSVALGEHIPLGISSSSKNVAVEGYEVAKGQTSFAIQINIVDENYFKLIQIPVVSGRTFDSHDTSSSPPVAIVNQVMAEKYWPKRNAIGGRIRMGKQTLEVVGIAKTIHYRDVSESPLPFLYLPFSQQYSSFMTLHVESAGDPASLAAPVLAEVRRLDPGTPVADIQTLDHVFHEGALFGTRLITQAVTVIGLFGLLLASAGLYGVIAYSVSRRTREIGIRVAIGADPRGIARLVLRQGLTLTFIGVGIGLLLALSVSKLLASLLVGVSSHDPFVFIAVTLILAAVSLLACYVPARRAARVDPLLALRQD